MASTEHAELDRRQQEKRKYQVFISSTFEDLKEHRLQAMLGILAARHLPLALEYHPADSSGKLDVIQEAIADCQFYVIILGHRYGTVDRGQNPGEEKSYIELELDYAERMKLKVVPLVMRKSQVEKLRNNLALPQDEEERKNERLYWTFYERLTKGIQGPFYQLFDSPSDVYLHTCVYFGKDYPDIKGYLREPVDIKTEDLIRISTNNEIVRETIGHLGQFKFVDPRLSVARDKKQALASAFRQLHRTDVRARWKKIFFESGSTVAYVAKEIAVELPKKRDDHKIVTNNSLAYLFLWLCSGVLCHPEPDGPPDAKYGGMFGALMDRDRAPDYTLPPLEKYDSEGEELVRHMSTSIFGNPENSQNSILLAAASGLQLSEDFIFRDAEGEPYVGDPEILQQLSRCRGIHGGSYQNRLFKRCMYLSQIPTIVFMHDDKIDCPIRVGICHFLFDDGYTWSQFIEHYPLSVWVACNPHTVRDIERKLKRSFGIGSWKVSIYAEGSRIPILIAHNQAFRNECKRTGATVYER
jgi:hypothetical protein